jgi:hypothetical protein
MKVKYMAQLEFVGLWRTPLSISIIQSFKLQHRITVVPKLGWKGQVFPACEPPRSFRNPLLPGFPGANIKEF